MTEKPNILYVFADQMRAGAMGHMGQEPVITPNLDRFAGEGVRFTRCVANCAICSPMRASMFTGQYPLTHGVVHNFGSLRQDSPSLAGSLAAAGYRTGYIGKWHLDGPESTGFTPPGPRRHGFEYWAAFNCNHLYFESFYYRDTPEPIWIDTWEPHAQTDLAIEFLEESAGGDRPFCLFLAWGPPHCPYDHVPNRFRRLYDERTLPVRPNAVDPDRGLLADYYANVTGLDWNFGRLLEALNRLGLEEETLVIFSSDHGDMMFSQNRGWKCKPWQEATMVPFIARWPGRTRPGAVETRPFGLVHLMPTLLALTGTPLPDGVEGSAWPEVVLGRGGPAPESEFILFPMSTPSVQSYGEWRGLVTERHTYARFRDRPWVLYDDLTDPYQMHNLVDDPRARPLLEEMERLTREWMEKTNDPFETFEEVVRRYGLELTGENRTGEPHHSPYPDHPWFFFRRDMWEEMRRRARNRDDRKTRA